MGSTMNKILIPIFYISLCIPFLYSDDFKVQQEIVDPMGNDCHFPYRRILQEKDLSENEETEYREFEDDFFLKLEPLVGYNEFRDTIGYWFPNNDSLIEDLNNLGIVSQGLAIIPGAKELIFLKYNNREASKLYKYADYYVTQIPIEGRTIGLLVLLNICDEKCFLYTLEDRTWILLPFHKGGNVYWQRES